MRRMAKPSKETLYENLALEIRRGALVLAVLSQLRQEQYGYSLKQSLSKRGLEINEGTLYPLLRRLEKQGLLKSNWQVIDDARPRRYYRLSATGETILCHLTAEWDALVGVMANLLVAKMEVAPNGIK
jgi:PadR family transcriptional regulator PadR